MAFPQKPDKPRAPPTGQPSPVPSTPPFDTFPDTDGTLPVWPSIPEIDDGWDPDPPAPDVNIAPESGIEEQTATFAAKGAAARLSYGTNVRLGGRPYAWGKTNEAIVVGYEFGWGEIDPIEIRINGEDVFSGVAGTHGQTRVTTSGISVTQYHGTDTQAVDATFVAVKGAGYVDDLVQDVDGTDIGYAHMVIKFPPGSVSGGLPNVEWIFQGRQVSDPRIPGNVHSDNPALILADLISNAIYGQGKTVDSTSVETLADDHDELVSGSKRRTLNIVLDQARDTAEWVDRIAGDYCSCWVVPEGAGVKLVSDRATAVVAKAFTEDDILQGSLRTRITGLDEAPTWVRVDYTDTTTDANTNQWATGHAEAFASGVEAGTTPRRPQTITLAGIQDHSQAKRAAIERLNRFTLQREIVQFVTFAEGIRWQAGDRITLTHWRGYSTDDFRLVANPQMVDIGEQIGWRCTARNYDALIYSDAVESAPTPPDPDLDDPLDPPVVTNLVVSDHVQQFSTHANLVLRITWTDPSYHVYPQTGAFRIVVTGERDIDGSLTNLIHEGFAHSVGQGNTNEYTTPGLLAPRESTIFGDLRYKVDVYTRSAVPGVESAAVTTTYTAIGKGHPPGNVQRLDAEIVNGKVELSWPEVYDLDLIGYLVRESPAGTINQAWASMTPVPSPGGRLVTVQNRMVIRSPGEPDDVIEYAVKAIDSGRRQSADEKRTQVLLTDLSTSPSEKIEHWPRTGAWALDVTLDGFYDILIPGDGWYFIAESDDHDIDQRWGTSSPANNVDKPPHYGNDSWTTHSSPDPRVLALFKTFSGGFEMREFQWQMYKEEWDEDANIVTTGLIAEYQTGINTGHTPTTQGYAGQSVVANADKIRWLISFPKASLPDGNWSMVIRAPIVISGQKAVLEQSATMTGLASSYPKTATLDNTFWKKYNSAPLVNLTVETNNASARLTAAPTTTLISVDVLPDSGDPTVTVRWIARGS